MATSTSATDNETSFVNMAREKIMEKHIDEILELIDWEKAWTDIPPNNRQVRIEDDSDDGKLAVVFSCDGDAWIATYPSKSAFVQSGLRFRIPGGGGGQSSRVRKALMVLAMAIKADNEDNHQQ